MNMKNNPFVTLISTRLGHLVLAVLLVFMIGLTVYQSYRYERLLSDVRKYQKEQEMLFEQNKKDFKALSEYTSSRRLSNFEDKFGLSATKSGQTIIVKTRSTENSNAEWKE